MGKGSFTVNLNISRRVRNVVKNETYKWTPREWTSMERWEYGFLGTLALLIIAGGAVYSKPSSLVTYLSTGLAEAAITMVEMAWVLWWALVLGFAIAGGVEAWVDSESISSVFSETNFRSLSLATFFGFASSSCSYSAIATAKNLFKKGASVGTSLGAFMFASTNLVIELGLVIYLLLGPEFLVANYVGGLILIVIMAGMLEQLPSSLVETAREHISEEDLSCPVCGMDIDSEEAVMREFDGVETYFCSTSCADSFTPEDKGATSVLEEVKSFSGWQKLARKQWSEWGMLWEDIVMGVVFASLVSAFVPTQIWTALFGFFGGWGLLVWSSFIGAVIGILTFICSVGNVPFAAIIWVNGLPFGGVFSYIYADLVVPPIVRAYNEYYGKKFGFALSGVIFVSAVVTGIITHLIFSAIGLIPPTPTGGEISGLEIELDYKAVLNGLATILFVALWWLKDVGRDKEENGSHHGEHHH